MGTGEADRHEGAPDCTGGLCFFFRNSALRLAFLLCVEGLNFFLVRGAELLLSLVSREKEKVESILMEKEKPCPGWPMPGRKPSIEMPKRNLLHLVWRQQSFSLVLLN